MDWNLLQLHGIARDEAFEALTTHLFERWLRSEYGSSVVRFHSLDGCGGDGGVEAFAELDSGEVIGLQCKWFRNSFVQREVNQLRKSIDQARKRHSNLKRYVVAMPQRLKDAKAKKGDKSGIDRWNDLTGDYPAIDFVRWDDHRLEERLIASPDLREHWFGHWQSKPPLERVVKAKKSLRVRYSPDDPHLPGRIETAVLQHAHAKDACQRAAERISSLAALTDKFEKAIEAILEHRPFRSDAQAAEDCDELRATLAKARTALEGLRLSWLEGGIAPATVPKLANEYTRTMRRLQELDGGLGGYDPLRPEREALDQLAAWVARLDHERKLRDGTDGLLAIVGPPGCGKTHGLVASAEAWATSGGSTFLIPARFVDPKAGWQPILSRLLDRPSLSIKGALAALEAEAHCADARFRAEQSEDRSNTRTLLIIDALEESRPNAGEWVSLLGEILVDLQKYPRIALVVSLRTSARSICLPNDVRVNRYHVPAAGDADLVELVKAYCSTYNIDVDDPIMLAAVLRVPLAVKLFASLNRRRTVPRSTILTSTLPRLVRKWLDVIENELASNDPSWRVEEHAVLRALTAISAQLTEQRPIDRGSILNTMLTATSGVLDRKSGLRLLDKCCQYAVLDQFEISGTDPLDPPTIVVDLAYEFFADFLAARAATEIVVEQFGNDQTTSVPPTFLNRPDCQPMAVAMLLGHNIMVSDPRVWIGLSENERERLLIESIPWVDRKILELKTENPGDSPRIRLEGLLSLVLTETMPSSRFLATKVVEQVCHDPGHPFGSSWLDKRLRALPTVERDAVWSTPDYIPRNHGAKWEGRGPSLLDDFSLWPGEPWNAGPLYAAWCLTSLVEERVRRSRGMLAQWATSNVEQMTKLIDSLLDVDDPQLIEELFLAAAEAALFAPRTEVASLDLMARLTARALFGLEDGQVTPNVRQRVAGRIIVEQAAARSASLDEKILEAARPPYPRTDQLLPFDDAAAQQFIDSASHQVRADMLDWDRWQYIVRPTTRHFFTRTLTRPREPEIARPELDVAMGVRNLVNSGVLRLSCADELVAVWQKATEEAALRDAEAKSRREADGVALQVALDEMKARMAAGDSVSTPAAEISDDDALSALYDHIQSLRADKDDVGALSEAPPPWSEDCIRLLEAYENQHGVLGLTPDSLAGALAVAHVKRCGWTESIHLKDPRGGEPGEILGLDIALLRAYPQARHSERSRVATVAEKYAFTASHVILGHLAQELAWHDPHSKVYTRCLDETLLQASLLKAFPTRSASPNIDALWPSWRPVCGAPTVAVTETEPVDRASARLKSAPVPNPADLLVGPVSGSVVIASAYVHDTIGSIPRPALWVSTLAVRRGDIELLVRDLRLKAIPGDHLHDTFQEHSGIYMPSDVVAVSAWTDFVYGRWSYTTVDDSCTPRKVTLTSLAVKILDHDGESELESFVPGSILRAAFPIVSTAGNDTQRHFLDPHGKTRAVAQRSGDEYRWRESHEVMFASLKDVSETLLSEELTPVWAVRLYWEVPSRLWANEHLGQNGPTRPTISERDMRWVLWHNGKEWQVLAHSDTLG